jgi:hypothetical protein
MAQTSARLNASSRQSRRVSDGLCQHGFNCDLLNSLGRLPTVFRDTFFATWRAHAANDAGLRFGTGLILGFAVGGL